MATVNHSQYSFAERDPAVASSSSHARRDFTEPRREPAAIRDNSSKTVHSGAADLAYPVVLRLADVSSLSAEELVHLTQLQIDSALESIGSGKASLSTDLAGNTPNLAANSFASLLAASPSLQRTRTVENASAPARTIAPEVTRPVVPPPRREVMPFEAAPVQAAPLEAAPEPPPAERSKLQKRIDRPVIKPMRRPFKITRPAWMPEVPPTLVLGMLICFSALLIGMLWSGNDHDSPANMTPAAHDQPVPSDGAAAPPKVAAVPKVPTVLKANGRSKEATEVTAAKPSAKKVSQAKSSKRKKPSAETVSQLSGETQPTAKEIPAPRITGIRALPPVETYTQDKFYGQPIGGPTPQIVENPHVNGQSAVYEARRPPVRFEGTITPPDAAAPNERF
jgi:hypothetical protein